MKLSTIRVNVTARDIRDGAKGRCDTCPVARAITRRVTRPPYVTTSCVRIGQMWLALSNKACTFIEDFDNTCRRDMRPFSFMLKVPARLVKR